MAEFNQCAGLLSQADIDFYSAQYREHLANGVDPYSIMLQNQDFLQKELATKNWSNLVPSETSQCGEKVDVLRLQWDYLSDEFRELLTSLGGMSNGKEASAVWKTWKTRNEEARATDFFDLSLSDRVEVMFEMVDMVHFFMNMMATVGVDAEAQYVLYMIKNKENLRRKDSGY